MDPGKEDLKVNTRIQNGSSKTVDILPDEVLDYILSLVSTYGDLRACFRVCRRWRNSVQRVAHNHGLSIEKAMPEMRLIWSSCSCQNVEGLQITKRYSHSSVYDDGTMSMFVFGGCTSTSTTFNDLWRLDLTTRTWHRPTSDGTYPSPKACSVLVRYEHDNLDISAHEDDRNSSLRKKSSLLLFGGWTHPSLYPLHQSWKLFNELHRFDVEQNHWTQIPMIPGASKPPPMAGHSASVHGQFMIIFGGLQKQRSSIGQFSSSNDVWSFDIKNNTWTQEDVPEPRPQARYGQSQLYLDDMHLLILGGSGGPSNIFNDVWVLSMEPGSWKWVECTVKNADKFGALHMWCHPACKVGNYAVILGKNRSPKPPSSPQVSGSASKEANAHREARWNVIPQLRRGLNRGYGAIRRPNNPQASRNLSVDGAAAAAIQRRSQSMDDEVLMVRSPDDDISANLASADPEDMSISSDNEELVGNVFEDLEPIVLVESAPKVLEESAPNVFEKLTPNVFEDSARNVVEESFVEDDEQDFHMDIAVDPVIGNIPNEASDPAPVYRSSVTLNINSSLDLQDRQDQQKDRRTDQKDRQIVSSSPPLEHPRPGPSMPSPNSLPAGAANRPYIHVEPLAMPRMQAFVSTSTTASSSASRNAFSAATRKQVETRQRQLDSLRRMEERYRNLTAPPPAPVPTAGPSKSQSPAAEKSKSNPILMTEAAGLNSGRCSCHRLAMYVLDISKALTEEHVVEWLPFRSNASLNAPEETILYTLVSGRSELIMFGGIQKDVSTITSGRNTTSDKETVFNEVYFLTPPIQVV